MNDVQCPYCNSGNDICHEDGAGYAEDEFHRQDCKSCEKTFVFTARVSYSYNAKKADCLNGGEHNWNPTVSFPKYYTEMVCETCDERRKLTKAEKEQYNIPDKFTL